MKTIPALAICPLLVFLIACKKESFITSPDAQVTITTDTLRYDTVFTTTGSFTQSFKIINENDQKLNISSVMLTGGATSPFHINADGLVGPEVDNIQVGANDSVYVFVSVTINPNAANLPFIVRDSIRINYNGKSQWVQLQAFGQNAHFFRGREIAANETWVNDLPYVILGSLTVDANRILTIDKGCRIYVHADAPIIINGSLQANGQKDSLDRVYFRGDRLDDPYSEFPAGWPGILFNTSSKDNVLNFTVLKNAFQAVALQDPSQNANPKLRLNECIIDNAYDAGIVAVNGSVYGENCLVSNCGKNVYLLKGGDYQFVHCTFASYSNNYILHMDPVLLVSNYVTVNNIPQALPLTAVFRNCIFWGDGGLVDDEVVVAKDGGASLSVNFDHDLWKAQKNDPSSVAGVSTSQIIANQNPLFENINTSKKSYSFRLQATSPAKDKGANTGLPIDLDGSPRPVGLPDLGAYENK
jgi:hypothetical protein